MKNLMIKLMQGDCISLLDDIEDNYVDMVLTDPPYSSGGLFAGQRKKETGDKYTSKRFNGSSRFANFSGDNMDQRSFTEFMRMVLAKCRQKTKPEGICAVFTDWRQLPAMTDALQMAGWIYRGIVVWDKGNSRPIPNRFRNDCEYIVWGTNGQTKAEYKEGVSIFPGCYHISSVASIKKHHQTEKPVPLIENLIKICPDNGIVLDCFMGSGTTGVACVNTDRNFIGIEIDKDYHKTAVQRINKAQELKKG